MEEICARWMSDDLPFLASRAPWYRRFLRRARRRNDKMREKQIWQRAGLRRHSTHLPDCDSRARGDISTLLIVCHSEAERGGGILLATAACFVSNGDFDLAPWIGSAWAQSV